MRYRYSVCGMSLALLLTSAVLEASVRQKSSSETRPTSEVKKTLYGFKVGYFGSGDVTIKNGWEYTAELESGYSFAGFVDFRTRAMTSLGLSLEMHHIKPAAMDIAKNMIDISMNLKGAFHRNSARLVVRPCLGLGFGMLGGERVGWFTVHSSNYFIVKGTLELLVLGPGKRPGFVWEMGIITAPWGKESGSNGYSLSAAPRLLARLGIVFR